MRVGGERPGWGWVMEFYVVPGYRGRGLGAGFYGMCESLLEMNGASSVWLTAGLGAVSFWVSVGYRRTGERA